MSENDNQNESTGWTGGQNAFGDFAPGIVHYTDKILLCAAGSGWFHADGKDPVSMEPGTVIRVPAGPSTDTAPRPTRGSPTSPSSPPDRTPATSARSPSPTRPACSRGGRHAGRLTLNQTSN